SLCQPGPQPTSARTPGGTRATKGSSRAGRGRRRGSIQSSTLCSYTSTVRSSMARGRMPDVVLPGQVEGGPDVAPAVARVVAETAPRSIALSGGETAEECYAALAGEPIDWQLVDVFFGDDRNVAADHADSNEGMARHVLLDRNPPRAIYSMVGLGTDSYDK